MEALPASHALLNVSLNAIDLIFAFFLVLGGWDMTASHPITGSVCLVLAPLLLFCSFAVWKESRLSFVAHVWLYWGVFGVLGVSVVVTTVAGALHFSGDWIIYLVVLILLVAAVLSAVRLRVVECDR